MARHGIVEQSLMGDDINTPRIAKLKDNQTPKCHDDDRGVESRGSTHIQSVSPLTQLPVDLWENIFLQCLANSISRFKNASIAMCTQGLTFHPGMAPLLLCRVCRSWRALAVSMPRLWCSLRIMVYSGRSYPGLELISLWCSRSKSLPLSFTVTQRSESSQTQEKTLQVLNLLTEQIPRWRDARLYLAGAEPRKILSIVNAHALLLEHFEMKTFQQNVPDGEFLYRVFEHPVPKLTKLAISAIPHADFWRDPAAGHIPWHQLTSLTIDFVTVPSAVGVLRDCHILQNCILGLQSSTHSAGLLASTSPLIHGTLEVLELEAERDDLTLFLDYTLIPALDVLTIHGKGSGNTEYWPQAHLEDHLERSGSRPRVLSIRTGWLHEPDSHLFFQHQGIQDLVELKILDELDWSHSNSSWFTHAVLESLTPGRCENVSLPKLEILEFRGYLVGIRASDILRFVESRWRCGGGGGESLGTSRLKATCLMDSSRMFFKCTEEERRICLQLRREGMDLVLTSEE